MHEQLRPDLFVIPLPTRGRDRILACLLVKGHPRQGDQIPSIEVKQNNGVRFRCLCTDLQIRDLNRTWGTDDALRLSIR